MNRRQFITLFGGTAAWPLAARAQQADKVRTVGYLAQGTPGQTPVIRAFFDALPELGWIEGKNIVFERRYAENRLERLAGSPRALMTDAVEKVTARRLWNRKTQQSNREEWFRESTLRSGA
jgi:putative ABC transport system substrate-binding protein